MKVMPRNYEELPGTILTNSLAREFEKGNLTWQSMKREGNGDRDR